MVRNGSRLVYATTNMGLHVSRDDGRRGSCSRSTRASQYTRGVVPRADRSGFVLLCNGDGPPGSWGKLMRSRDHGAHLEDARLPGETQSSAWCVATNPADPKLIFAATALGQYLPLDRRRRELDRAAAPPDRDRARWIPHDPEKWYRFSDKVMLKGS